MMLRVLHVAHCYEFLPTEEGLIAYDAEIAAPVFDKVMRIFADHLAIARDELDANTFIREIGADSLDIVELVMELEEEFGVTASDSVAENIRTIADAIRYIIERLRERG
jgi:acyl carrier protein